MKEVTNKAKSQPKKSVHGSYTVKSGKDAELPPIELVSGKSDWSSVYTPMAKLLLDLVKQREAE